MDIGMLEIGITFFGLFILGHLINYVSEAAYWAWVDWKTKNND